MTRCNSMCKMSFAAHCFLILKIRPYMNVTNVHHLLLFFLRCYCMSFCNCFVVLLSLIYYQYYFYFWILFICLLGRRQASIFFLCSCSRPQAHLSFPVSRGRTDHCMVHNSSPSFLTLSQLLVFFLSVLSFFFFGRIVAHMYTCCFLRGS